MESSSWHNWIFFFIPSSKNLPLKSNYKRHFTHKKGAGRFDPPCAQSVYDML